MNGRFLLLVFSFCLIACKDDQKAAPPKVDTLPPQYYYFPRANVYFDSANKDYLFLTADSSAWQSSKQIPAVVHSMMDKSVLIENPSQPVWKDNDKHKLVYSALLYATPNDTIEKKEPPKPLADTPKKTEEEVKPPKKRSGVRRFLDKIFGGKKKKDTAEGN